MPLITPFSITPDQGLDRFTGYWFATLCRCGYINNLTQLLSVGQIAGANEVKEYLSPRLNVPKCYLFRWPNNDALWLVNGTTVPTQYMASVLGAQTLHVGSVPGAFNSFFWSAYLQLSPPVILDLVNRLPNRLNIMGHSLGGAIGTLASQWLRNTFNVVGTWSIGSPRVGDLVFGAAFNIPYTRITDQGDIVPCLPPSTNTFMDVAFWPYFQPVPTSYRHVGTRFHLYVDGTSAALGEFSTLEEAIVFDVQVRLDSSVVLTAHDTPEYARRLRVGIPVAWRHLDPQYPGLKNLDDLNFHLNGDVDWSFNPPTVESSRQPANRGPFAVMGVC